MTSKPYPSLRLTLLILSLMPWLTQAQTPTAETGEASQLVRLEDQVEHNSESDLADDRAPEVKPTIARALLVDLLVFAYNTVDTSDEHWRPHQWDSSFVTQLFYPGYGAAGDGFDYPDRKISYAWNEALITSRQSTPIDEIVDQLTEINASLLVRRQWRFDAFDINRAPWIRINDFQVWIPRDVGAYGSPAPSATRDDPRLASEQSEPPSAWTADLPRCQQNLERRLVVDKSLLADDASDPPVTASPSLTSEVATDPPIGSPSDSSKSAQTLTLEQRVQLAAVNLVFPPQQLTTPSLTRIDYADPSTNRLDGRVRLFYSRFNHVELQLQFLRPYLSSRSAESDSESQASVCLLGFQLQENRRLKQNEVHYFDHPAFGAVLFFTELQPVVEEAVDQPDSLESDDLESDEENSSGNE